MSRLATFVSSFAFAALCAAQREPFCPDPTGSATIAWPDDVYAQRQITVAVIGSEDAITTYTGIDCQGNPHSMTIVAGPSTFSLQQPGGSIGGEQITRVNDCKVSGENMICTLSQEAPGTYTTTTTYSGDGIYDVTMALGPSGSFEPGTPTHQGPQYTGCPPDFSNCDNGWCCPQDMICTTVSVVGLEACATGTNDDAPGPAIPFITGVPGNKPDDDSGGESGDGGNGDDGGDSGGSTGAAVPALPRPTGAPQVVGGLLGLAMAFI